VAAGSSGTAAHPGKTQSEALARMEPLQKLVVEAYRQNSPAFAENFAQFHRQSDEEQTRSFMTSWLSIGPTVVLLMIPVMAFWLKLAQLGTGWRYGEHLVFSVHWLSAALLGLVFSTFTSYTLGTRPVARHCGCLPEFREL